MTRWAAEKIENGFRLLQDGVERYKLERVDGSEEEVRALAEAMIDALNKPRSVS